MEGTAAGVEAYSRLVGHQKHPGAFDSILARLQTLVQELEVAVEEEKNAEFPSERDSEVVPEKREEEWLLEELDIPRRGLCRWQGCDPDGNQPCCSVSGWCGNSPEHCRCKGCIDPWKHDEGPFGTDGAWWLEGRGFSMRAFPSFVLLSVIVLLDAAWELLD